MDIRSVALGLAMGLILTACDMSVDAVSGPGASLGLQANGVSASAFVTGSGHFYSQARQGWRTFSINGKVMPDGSVDGTWQLRVHRPGGGGAKLRGRVTCMVIEGNRAWLAGIVEHAASSGNVGKAYGFKVVDNGQGQSAVPDQFASRRFPPSADGYCADKPDDVAHPVNDMEAGNIQIHGG